MIFSSRSSLLCDALLVQCIQNHTNYQGQPKGVATTKTIENITHLRYNKSKIEVEEQNMTDQELKDLVASLAISQRETSEQMKKTDEKLNRIAKLVGAISNNQGDVAEEFFWNSISSHPTLGGISYDYADKNRHKKVGDIEDEYDILLVNGNDIAIIETKYKAHEKDIIKLINKKYANFQKLYPEYRDYNHHLGLASFYINDDIKNSALKNNIMVLQRKGDVIETILPNKE
ncbi:MAG: hypothetical protein U9N49_01535 [Campylobacterota bacterium]|nr:hypothetical protein [Campylobacterota bacterium]